MLTVLTVNNWINNFVYNKKRLRMRMEEVKEYKEKEKGKDKK